MDRTLERHRRKIEEIGEWLRNEWDQAEVYAYGKDFLNDGRWHYKSVWVTPFGCVKFDTGYTIYLTKREANTLIKNYKTAKWPLVRVPPAEVVESWRCELNAYPESRCEIAKRIVENYSS